MKKKLLWFITFLPTAITLLVLQFLPERIPMHYNAAGAINRWGSKYETFIFPVVIIFLTLFWNCFLKHYQRIIKTGREEKEQKEAENNYKVIYIVAIGMALAFGVLHYISMYSAVIEARSEMTEASLDKFIVVNVVMSFFIIVVGNFLPKAKNNQIVGLRTKWSKHSDSAWADSNRFSGKLLVASGILTIIESLLIGGITSTIIMVVILLAAGIFAAIYSYNADQKRSKEQ